MRLKNLPVAVKAGPDDGLKVGEFTAYASVFGNRDSYGDIVVKGAFADTLSEWADSGDTIPLLFGHRMDDPDFNIGGIKSAVEDDRGLLVTAELDLDNPKAAQVYRMLKGRRINQMSFAYDVTDAAEETADGETSYMLRALKLYEVSVVPIGANQETEILAVKANADALEYEVKAGRVLAQKHIDSLRAAQDAIGAVIEAAEANDQEKASGEPAPLNADASDDQPDGAKSESVPAQGEPTSPSVDAYLAVISTQEKELR